MQHSIRILAVEDNALDAELQFSELRRAGLAFTPNRVETEEAFRGELEKFAPDIILSDFSLPGFDGLCALAIARERSPHVPFIFVSGTIGEERAIESFNKGATDYVMKTNLARLAPVVRRALEEADERVARKEAVERLQQSEEKFRAIVETAQEWIWETDRTGRFTFSSPYVEQLLAYEPRDILGADGIALLHDEDREPVRRLRDELIAKKSGWSAWVSRWRHHDGTVRWLESDAMPVLGIDGSLTGYRGANRNVTERVLQQQRIARLSRIHAVLSGINSTIVRVRNREQLFDEACHIAVEHGKFRMAWIGLADPETPDVIVVASAEHEESQLTKAIVSARVDLAGDECPPRLALRSGKPVICNDISSDSGVAALREDGDKYSYGSMIALPLLSASETKGVLVLYASEPNVFDHEEQKLLSDLAADVSLAMDHINTEEKLRYVSYYDMLTGLPNRALFCDRLGQLITGVRLKSIKVAVAVMEVEHLRGVNESFGRHVGDELLRWVAQRLSTADGRSIARVSADCFAVALPGVDDESDIAHALRDRILNVFSEPFQLPTESLQISARSGVAIFPDDGNEPEALLMNAEAALRETKTSRERYSFYAPKINQRVIEQLKVESRLRTALAERQFRLHYQPKISARTGAISGMEALIRWASPELGLVPPNDFIPMLEDMGLILDVGRWVLEQAAADYRSLRANRRDVPRVAINVSALQLRRKEFLVDLQRVAATAEMAAGLDLEITESVIMEDVDQSLQTLAVARKLGMNIAIDDFGTGQSSLSYLVKLPANYLKIDRSFIANLTAHSDNEKVVAAVISLAHSIGMTVVAEGVETSQQAGILRELDCDELQGYLFSRPLPLAQINAFLRQHRSLGTSADLGMRKITRIGS